MTNFLHHGRYFILSPVTVTVAGTTSLRDMRETSFLRMFCSVDVDVKARNGVRQADGRLGRWGDGKV